MKISILGDSISSFEGVSLPRGAEFYSFSNKLASGVTTQRKTWWGIVLEKMGWELLVNNSISGSTVCYKPEYEFPSYGCSDERTSALSQDGVFPDLIFVFLGTNDFGMGIPVVPENGKDGEEVFSKAYRSMLNKIRANYPNAEIFCFTIAPATRKEEREETKGKNLSDYNAAICTAAKETGCSIIELDKLVSGFDTFDDIHPTDLGMKTLAEAVVSELNGKV